jgi:hypothetical protein
MLTKSPFKSNCCSPYHCCGCLNLCGEVAVLAPCDGCNGCPCMIMFPCFMDFYPGLQDAQAFVDFIIVAREDFKQRKRACARAGTCVLRVARAPPCRAAGADARLCRVDAQRSRRAPACSTPSAARKRAVHRVPSAAKMQDTQGAPSLPLPHTRAMLSHTSVITQHSLAPSAVAVCLRACGALLLRSLAPHLPAYCGRCAGMPITALPLL